MASCIRLAFHAVALALALAPPPRAAAQESPVRPIGEGLVLARIGGDEITLAAAMASYTSMHTGHAALVRGEAALRDLVGRVIERRILLAEAETLGVPGSDDVKAAVDDYRFACAKMAFWKREVDDKVDVPDEEVDRFYAKTDLTVRLQLILTADAESAEKLRARAAAGESFGDLAHEASIDPSRTFGGEIGWKMRGEVDAALEEAVFSLVEPGQLTAVTKTADGFAVMKVLERVENKSRPKPEVAKPQIRSVLKARKSEALRDEVKKRVLAVVPSAIDESLLTQELMLAKGSGRKVVANAGEAALTVQQMRDLLNLEAIRGAPADNVRKALKEMASDWVLEQAERATVAANGMLKDPEVEKQVAGFRDNAILGVFMRDWVYKGIEVAEAEARAFYDAHPDHFSQPPEFQIAHVVVKDEAAAIDVRKRLEAGEDFGKVARELSLDRNSLAHAGRVGWLTKGSMEPAVEKCVVALEPGQLGGPVQTEGGWHVLKLLDRRPLRMIPFDKTASQARSLALKEKQAAVYKTWCERLRERAQIEYDAAGVGKAVALLEEEAKRIDAEKAKLEADGAAKPAECQAKGEGG